MSKALLFIPDISGYTQFVTNTEISHQQHIITELLDILLDSNDIGLVLAEVEGDALFYYKTEEINSPEEILELVKKMFVRFHSHLRYYDKNRICHCGACEGATGLNLKFVIHYGDISFLTLKGQKPKPHGKEVITVHRLLKNSIESQEYVMVTEAYKDMDHNNMSLTLEYPDIRSSSMDFGINDVGEIGYRYAELSHLRKYVDEPKAFSQGYKNENPIIVETFIEEDPLELFEIMINFKHRLNYSKGLDNLEYNTREMNKAGSSHICIISDQQVHVDTIKADFGPDTWAFGERSNVPLVNEVYMYYVLTRDNDSTKLRIEAHPKPKGVTGRLLAPIFKWKFKSILRELSQELKSYAESR